MCVHGAETNGSLCAGGSDCSACMCVSPTAETNVTVHGRREKHVYVCVWRGKHSRD